MNAQEDTMAVAVAATRECPICIETFTGSTRKEVICQYCQYGACLKCMKQHLLNQQTPNCMSCHVEFNREFIDINMTKAFRTTELKQHRENVLLDREKSLLPATVVYAERTKELRKIDEECRGLELEKAKLREQMQELDKKIIEKRRRYHVVNGTYVANNNAQPSTSAPKEERKAFIKACVVDGCRGFLSTQYKCGICETWVCPDCHEVKQGQKDEEHKCNPELVESVKLIAKETKPCPKCAAAIFKVSGCHQIWCTECHTTFDWATGREEKTTNIHNPHYFEWVRRNNNGIVPRNPLDIPPQQCGNDILPYPDRVYRVYPANPMGNKLTSLLRVLIHIQEVEIRVNRVTRNRGAEELNRDLRVSYLLNEIDDATWKKQLQQREKKREFDTAKCQIFNMLVQVSKELYGELLAKQQPRAVFDRITTNMKDIIKYYNEAMLNVQQRFNSKAKGLIIDLETWDFKQ